MSSRYRFAAYLTGATAARTGDELSGPAVLLLGVGASGAVAGSALLAGLTVAAAMGGPLLGAVLDRSRMPGRILAVGLVGYAVGLTAITVLFGAVPFALVVAIAVVTGLLAPAIGGGWTAQVPALVPAAKLGKASTLDAMTFTAAALVGPGFAGVLATTAGAPAAVVLAGVFVLVAVPFAWRLPRSAEKQRPRFREAATVLVRNPALRQSTATSTLSCVGIGMAFVCYPLVGAQRLGSAGYGTLLLVGLSVASLLANAVLSRRSYSPDRAVRLSTIAIGIGLAGAAVAPNAALLVAAVALTGVGEGPQLASLFAVRHREAPPEMRAQVFTTAASIKIAGIALGNAVAGPLAACSPAAGLAAAAGTQVVAAVAHPLWTVRKQPVRQEFRSRSGRRSPAHQCTGSRRRSLRSRRCFR
ncbi:MFS transporter [Amycolatopsis dendrobii]|uniref:MFS transporter n=1 Tax=Amycolatopsis dendrobii TaxID=2760662 RepID=A0A7W3VVE4_9PSEU|nr:MFS transporter [Amycolatopsis dendrobii]MBB1153781.1 MFS transporter [Amycolatopsis dendrobii]